ncbi:MAG: hypothetical protein U0V48_06495 [Anaerolineales bacterium]
MCDTTPSLARTCAASPEVYNPPMLTPPSDGRESDAMICRNVVFPAPFGPKQRDKLARLNFKVHAAQDGLLIRIASPTY